MIQNTRSAMD